MRLKGKVAIVTGAGSGIGKAAAARFRAEGAKIVAADLRPSADTVVADAGCEKSVCHLIDLALTEHGGIDIFFANAGITGGLLPIFEETLEDWHEILRVNLIGSFLAVKHAAPLMKERGGGSIICTASVAGLRAGAGGAAYSASKAGLINLVKVAATQLAGSNVRVNAICPGLVETGITKSFYDAARANGREGHLGRLNPMKRGGNAGEIADAALFLASDESSYINGHALVVDGGLSISHPHIGQEWGRTSVSESKV